MRKQKERFESLVKFEHEDDQEMGYTPAQSKNTVANDVPALKVAGYQMPDAHKEKQLRACVGCKLVMSESQWRTKDCVNCPDEQKTTTT